VQAITCNFHFKPVLVHLVWKQITVLGFSNCVVCTLIIAVILCGNVCMYFEFIVYLASVNYLNISATNRRIFGRKISREASSAKRSIQKSPGVKYCWMKVLFYSLICEVLSLTFVVVSCFGFK